MLFNTHNRFFRIVITVTFVAAVSGWAFSALAQTEPRLSTRSIVACDVIEEACGIAVVSFVTGVPAIVPVGEPGVIVANQSFPSFATARAIIEAIKMGDDASTALTNALATDQEPELRQFGVAALDSRSPSGVTVATFTGDSNFAETCALTGDTHAVQANIQTTPEVCNIMADAFENDEGSLALRLLTALKAGATVGGDARGEFSASLKVFSESWALAEFTPLSGDANVNRAVDWEKDLTFEINAYLASLAPPDERNLIELTARRAKKIQRSLKRLGFYQGAVNGKWSDAAEKALLDFGDFNQGFPSGTTLIDGVRFVDGPTADYIVEGERRRVLEPLLKEQD